MATASKATRGVVVGNAWTNGNNATTLDSTNYATAAPGKNASVNGEWDFAAFTDGELPVGAVIMDIQVKTVYKVSTQSSVASLGVSYSDAGTFSSETTDTSEPLADLTVTSGFGTHPAGNLPTEADLKSAGSITAKIRAIRGNSNTAVTFSLDYVELIVTYRPAASPITGLSGITSGEAIGSSVLVPGGVTAVVSAIGSGEAIGTSSVLAGTVSLLIGAINSDEALGSAVVVLGEPPTGGSTIDLAGAGIESLEALGVPTAIPGGVVVPLSAIASDEAFGSPALVSGGVAIQPSGMPSDEAIGAPSTVPGGIAISPSGISSAEGAGSPTVVPGEVVVQTTAIDSNEASGSPTLQPGSVAILVTGIDGAPTVGDPTVGGSTSAVVIDVISIDSGESLGSATLIPTVAAFPEGIASEEALGQPSIGAGLVLIIPASVLSEEALGDPSLLAVSTLSPEGITTGELVGVPILTLGGQPNYTWKRAAGNAFGSASPSGWPQLGAKHSETTESGWPVTQSNLGSSRVDEGEN